MHCSSESHCLRVNCLKRNAYLKNRHKIELSTRLGHMFFSQSSIFLSEASQVLILIKASPVENYKVNLTLQLFLKAILHITYFSKSDLSN